MTGIWFYLRQRGMPERALRGALAFTALFPLFPLYAVTMVRDTLFSLACLALSVLLLEMARTKCACLRRVSFCCLLSLAAWLVMLTKSQGVYFVAVIGVACLAYKGARTRAAVALLVPAVLFQTVWLGILLPMWNVAPVGRQEALGPMFQQTARYVVTYPDDVSEKEADVIRAVIDYDHLPELYDPMLSDPVKFTFRQDCLDEWLRDYYKVWWDMLLRHPDVYLQAFIHNVYTSFCVGCETALSYTHYDSMYAMPYPELYVRLSDRIIRQEPVAQTAQQGIQRLPVVGLLFRASYIHGAVPAGGCPVVRRRTRPPTVAAGAEAAVQGIAVGDELYGFSHGVISSWKSTDGSTGMEENEAWDGCNAWETFMFFHSRRDPFWAGVLEQPSPSVGIARPSPCPPVRCSVGVPGIPGRKKHGPVPLGRKISPCFILPV